VEKNKSSFAFFGVALGFEKNANVLCLWVGFFPAHLPKRYPHFAALK
jgi:hypothetical protein